ncbi:hypothetical protein PaeCFBP13512_18500 [Paenibacillus sp. CFBP13512]|uniref:hypothetical protein n=1 Tax=Paenibacillus sp. CFBP13512 TaxID=2184007 RepID=UPI0010C0D8E0|nr:hypothetical protein [Paenibacillus sp. CFBP13512]TKJ87214.1 hypothetical protein PaeCFBP13512_18500 [Paenibacillus sp. CFBP13512]
MQIPEMVKISLHRKELFDYTHTDLSSKKLLKAPKTLTWAIGSVCFSSLGSLLLLFFDNKLWILAFIFLVSGVLCLIMWILKTDKYMAQQYPDYLKIMDRKEGYQEFLKCYKTQLLYKKVTLLHITSTQLDADIEYFQSKGVKITEHKRTYMLTLVAFLFAIWGAVLGKSIGASLSQILLFSLYAALISYLVFVVNYVLQKTVFSGFNKNKEMAELLAEVKNLISQSA